jgi:hypothetical protein
MENEIVTVNRGMYLDTVFFSDSWFTPMDRYRIDATLLKRGYTKTMEYDEYGREIWVKGAKCQI